MLLAINALRLSSVNGRHEVTPLALELKLVAHGLAFKSQIIMSPGSSELFS